MTKTEFIASLPKLSAKEVVAEGAKKELKLTEAYVYNVRSALKKRSKKKNGASAAKPAVQKQGSVAPFPSAVSANGHRAAQKKKGSSKGAVRTASSMAGFEQQIRSLVFDVGIKRAGAILTEAHKRAHEELRLAITKYMADLSSQILG